MGSTVHTVMKPVQRVLGIVWLGTLSVRAPHYEISGKHATPYELRASSNASMHPRLPDRVQAVTTTARPSPEMALT